MKKLGFTLAEVLITMTIIGVVAALTTPALFHHANNAQVGPMLAKIKATIENANQQLMQDEEVGRLSTLWSDLGNNGDNIYNRYVSLLSNYMRLDDQRGPGVSKDMSTYYGAVIDNNNGLNMLPNTLRQRFNIHTVEGMIIGFNGLNANPSSVFVDINGNTPPNRFGKDIFMFRMDDRGMLTPFGEDNADANFWQNVCPTDGPVGDTQVAGLACTATIFANGQRVTYDE